MRFALRRFYTPIKNFLLVIVGTLILAFGTAIFILPFDLMVGGISSYAILAKKLISVEWLTIDLVITILTWGLFFLGLLVLGKDFALKTLISTVVYPIGISLFLRLNDPAVLGGFFCMTNHPNSDLSLIMAAVVGGILIGLGCAIAFLGGGSTGGTDVVAFVICKYFKRLRSSVVIFCVDGFAILLGVFAVRDLTLSLLGVFSVLISALMIDKVFLGGNQAYVAQIVTDHPEEVSRELIEKIARTTTRWESVGGYTGKKHTMVMISFTMRQYADVMSVVRREDPDAFVTIHRAHEINGEGWTR
ncbi:MAG: YitT family protein [Clostridia bacterium]|nr:YitT family protein [Clostridia bacterium]